LANSLADIITNELRNRIWLNRDNVMRDRERTAIPRRQPARSGGGDYLLQTFERKRASDERRRRPELYRKNVGQFASLRHVYRRSSGSEAASAKQKKASSKITGGFEL